MSISWKTLTKQALKLFSELPEEQQRQLKEQAEQPIIRFGEVVEEKRVICLDSQKLESPKVITIWGMDLSTECQYRYLFASDLVEKETSK